MSSSTENGQDSNHIELQDIHNANANPNVAEAQHTVVESQSVSTSTPPPVSTPEPIKLLKETWIKYVESRVKEWKILFIITGVFVPASLGIFQLVKDEPIARSMIILAICCVISSVALVAIYLFRFPPNDVESIHYGFAWLEEARKDKIWHMGIMLSLPSVAALWSGVLILLSISCYIWRLSTDTGPTTLSAPPASLLKVAITIMFALDLVSGVWIWRTLNSIEKRSREAVAQSGAQ